MRVYKLFADITGTANAIASLTCIKNGKIVGVKWAVGIASKTDAAEIAAELSFQATSFIGSNDTTGPIDEIRAHSNFVTSGMDVGAVNQFTAMNVPFFLGEKLYINASVVVGTITAKATVFVYVEE